MTGPGLTLNSIWWWGSSYGALENIAMTLRVVVPVRVSSMCQIDPFERYLYLIGILECIWLCKNTNKYDYDYFYK